MKTISAIPNEESTLVQVRTEETLTQLSTCYYEVIEVLPFNWGRKIGRAHV